MIANDTIFSHRLTLKVETLNARLRTSKPVWPPICASTRKTQSRRPQIPIIVERRHRREESRLFGALNNTKHLGKARAKMVFYQG